MTPADRAALVAEAREEHRKSTWLVEPRFAPAIPDVDAQSAARVLCTLLARLADALEEDERALLQHHRFVVAWDVCESNRGRYSCSPAHDSRCCKDRGIGECTCGGDELDTARNAIAEHDKEMGHG